MNYTVDRKNDETYKGMLDKINEEVKKIMDKLNDDKDSTVALAEDKKDETQAFLNKKREHITHLYHDGIAYVKNKFGSDTDEVMEHKLKSALHRAKEKGYDLKEDFQKAV